MSTTLLLTELDAANRKVREWKREATQSPPVRLACGVDLTMPLEDMEREAEAEEETSSTLARFELLHTRDILSRLVHIPSITTTALVSAALGGVTAALLTATRSVGTASAGQSLRLHVLRHWTRRLLRLASTAVAAVLFVRFLRQRYPSVLRVSQYENLSSSADPPCFVASRVLVMSSSQAGTHADGPHHFCRSLSHRTYDDAHYSGDAVVLDMRAELRQHGQPRASDAPLAITAELLESTLAKLPTSFRDGSRPVWRLLLVTRGAPAASANVADVFLHPDAVEVLHRVFPHLLLVGIDSPSVGSPLHHTHSALLRFGVAMLENLRYTRLTPLLESRARETAPGCVAGSMLTVFNVTRNYDDARGCSVIFFPEEEPLCAHA
ncbi:putative cyclase [Novymonas esmeraldas]|uniref:Cyclase n=1 Tax=Novymonas esmeraldas TaxID=1808958 RepID=A0AAW0F040_9TRYP